MWYPTANFLGQFKYNRDYYTLIAVNKKHRLSAGFMSTDLCLVMALSLA